MKKIKNYAYKKIVVSTISLLLIFLFYLIPTHNNELITKMDSKTKNIVYLLDKDNYVSEVITYFDNNSINDEIINRINVLINGKDNFKGVIPENTIINSVSIIKDEVTIDFSKELLNTNNEEKMIESIVYTLTDINGINGIYIKVDGNILEKLPNSNKKLDYPLTRNFGINKEYDINSFMNIERVTVYFSKIDDIEYLVPITKITNFLEDKIEIIIKELKSSINSQNDLNGLLSNRLELLDYDIKDNIMTLKLNNHNNNSDYELLSRSIFENYDVNKIIFKDEADKENKVITRKTT